MNDDALIEKIKESLMITHRENHKNQKEWTTSFKQSLFKLGRETGYNVYPNFEIKEGEWLVDLCWAIEGKNWRTEFTGLKLTCEIEWSRKIDDILCDFQKLTVVDSEIRLFIFQFNYNDEYDEIIKRIKVASIYTKSKGYNYLIAASGNKEDEIRIKVL